MQLKDILKLQSTIDNKKTPEDIEKMMDRMLWSESKQTMIKIGDMHLDHYLRKVHNKLLDEIEPSTDELIEKLKGMKFLLFVGVEMKVHQHLIKLKTQLNFLMNSFGEMMY